MSRYRPPAKPMSNYITPEGEKALSEELHYLWKEERPLITQSVSEAAAQGDRSENAEYIYGKKRLREIDRRVRFLRKRLENFIVVDKLPSNLNKVFFGAWVELLKENEEVVKYRLIGPDEINPAKNYISIDSPMGKTLLGKQVDDEITINSPSGSHRYEILNIHTKKMKRTLRKHAACHHTRFQKSARNQHYYPHGNVECCRPDQAY